MIRKKKIVPVILGPTACGKTAVSLLLSELLDIEIISADSRQIYKYMDIGTAKPTKDELEKVRHHFISIIEPDEYYSAGKFAREANVTINEIFGRKRLPLIAGGTGLYIKALCEGFFEEKIHPPPELRKSFELRFESEGIETLYKELQAVDKASADNYPDKNPRRILRALEFYHTSGYRFSDARKDNYDVDFSVIYFGIRRERQELYDKINKRVEKMWSDGLAEETRKILDMGFGLELNALNTVGYLETAKYLNGICSAENAVEEIKKNTRHYAKRQLTWFNANNDIIWLEGSPGQISYKIESFLKIKIF